MNNKMKSAGRLNPWYYISTLYFTEGVPFIIVNQMSVALMKSLEVSNSVIGLTNFLYLPWSIKFLWSPIVDTRATKRKWVLWTQLLLMCLFGSSAVALLMFESIVPFIVLLLLTAFVSATQDIAIDGYYLYALNKEEQAFFSGIRSAFYRLAMIFSGGMLVFIAGEFGKYYGNIRSGWVLSFFVAFAVFFVFRIFHGFTLPRVENATDTLTKDKIPYAQIFREYFTQNKVGVVIAFILVYRFGEAMLLKMVQPFMLDKAELGGLGLSVSDVGVVYGTIGIIALVLGGIFGGWIVKKYSLRNSILPLAIFMHSCNLLWVILALFRFNSSFTLDLSFIADGFAIHVYPIIQSFVVIEQFSYGAGFTAFMVFLLHTSHGEYKTSHYAISTGIMALGMIVPGAVSGLVQESIGYANLFIVSTLITLPSLILIKYLPIPENSENNK
jgi:PAT family beta-lactamase induction signal transducer AmpG